MVKKFQMFIKKVKLQIFKSSVLKDDVYHIVMGKHITQK
ncbi:Uncharacterised protein [Legionella spiritensis]|nr:Uncharacterised protein [Legionella spiritensis]